MGPLGVLQATAALYVLAEGLLALNRMGPHTAHSIRFAYVMLAGGALAAFASGLGAPSVFECVFSAGLALYLAADRRKRKVRHGH